MTNRTISREELEKHSKPKSGWIAMHGRVYDVSSFRKRHPGGSEVVEQSCGQDVSQKFEDMGHSDNARELCDSLYVGDLEGVEKVGPGQTMPRLADLDDKESSDVALVLALFAGLGAVVAVFLYFFKQGIIG